MKFSRTLEHDFAGGYTREKPAGRSCCSGPDVPPPKAVHKTFGGGTLFQDKDCVVR